MIEVEEWATIPGYEGKYSVSSLGRVRSESRVAYCQGGVRSVAERMMKLNTNAPYSLVGLSLDGSRKSHGVHTLVALAFLGPRPTGMQVCHNNGDPHDNRLSNLRYGTPSENNLDKVSHGTHPESRKTHCPQGHSYSPENTAVYDGKRKCKKCSRASAYAAYLRKKMALL
ncbi:HNH endonuclease [Gordonia Phage JonJames]|nr:HNH endonuclease [Gordonia Phage JonJames]